MWVKERNKGKNKEKCVNRAIVPDIERVIKLVGQKITMVVEEVTVIEEAKRMALEVRVEELEQRLRDTVVLLCSFSDSLNKVEDLMVEDSDVEGEAAASLSSLDFGPVENMVVIPIPGPSVIHILTPIPDVFIPPYVQAANRSRNPIVFSGA